MTDRTQALFGKAFEAVHSHKPLVHCITNYVTVNDCANVLLAAGGSPIMADDIGEVEAITSICSALVLNIGTLNERTVRSMVAAGRKANALGHPVVLDPVGVGASPLRNEAVARLLREVRFSVIRGNISEVKALAGAGGATRGVDADAGDAVDEATLPGTIRFARALSAELGAVIAITGAIDIVADWDNVFVIRNGHPVMSKVTGTGCMLAAMLGAYAAVSGTRDGQPAVAPVTAAAAAVCLMGLAGEIAHARMLAADAGTGSFRMHLIDAISQMTAERLEAGAKVECLQREPVPAGGRERP